MLHALMINNMFAQVFSALTNLKAYHSYNMAHLQRSFARSNSSCSHRTHTHTRSRTPIRGAAAAAAALGQLSLDRFCYLGRFRYRSLSPTAQHPEKQCGLISAVVGRTFEQATRHFARLDNTPAAEEGSMQHAAGTG